jgi:uracil-DNA glycosylase
MISFNDLLEEEKQKDYYKDLIDFIDKEYESKIIFPPREKIFEAFKLTPFEQTKVVIIGQDPYHGEGEAHGLAFSVNNGIKIPPSLKNIYKEINAEYGYEIPNTGYLIKWAKQGVLMLNTVLTVEKDKPASHKAKGWEVFTDRVIEELNNSEQPLVFMLWGNYAKSKAQLINNPKHLILESAHPSPFSARNGFFGNNHFKLANDFLEKNGIEQIDWKIENYTEQTNEDAQLSIF